MRTKQEIIADLKKHANKAPDWDTTASLHERITIELLVDIRDVLQTRLISLDNTILRYVIPK